jgi:tRNA-specific 2-thiouridylase
LEQQQQHQQQQQQQQLMVKVRHGPSICGCKLWLGSKQQVEAWGERLAQGGQLPDPGTPAAATAAPGPEYGLVQLAEDDQGLAPGQYAVFYQDGLCLGAAKIVSPVVQQ